MYASVSRDDAVDAAIQRKWNATNNGQTPSMTETERAKLAKAMKNPEFVTLFDEYVKEISDPANRNENEMYLQQLEKEQNVPENKELIVPDPQFVLKLGWDAVHAAALQEKSGKLFLNVCSHPRIALAYTDNGTECVDDGVCWHVPFSLGPERVERDCNGTFVKTFDIVYNPKTIALAKKNMSFHSMVLQISMDAVGKQLHAQQLVLRKESRVLKNVRYKSGKPIRMCLKKEVNEDRSAHTVAVTDNTATKDKDRSFAIKKTLVYHLIHQGEFEFMDHMMSDVSIVNGVEPVSKRPKALIVNVAFPTRQDAKGIQLDVSKDSLCIDAGTEYEPLKLTLPFTVLHEKGSARFDKKNRQLVITLPVQKARVEKVAYVEKATVIDSSSLENSEDECECVNRTNMKETRPRESQSHVTRTEVKDEFLILRETALMIANDPLYQDLAQCDSSDRTQSNGEDHCASAIEEEAAPHREAMSLELTPSTDCPQSPMYTVNEHENGIDILVHVASIQSTSIRVEREKNSFVILFVASDRDEGCESVCREYQLRMEMSGLKFKIASWQHHVTSDNMSFTLMKDTHVEEYAEFDLKQWKREIAQSRLQSTVLNELD